MSANGEKSSEAAVRGTTRRRRTRRTREELTQVIVEAATDLFAAHGFSGPTTRDIANAAGVPLPTLYKFFEDKRALYDNCCKIALRQRMSIAERYAVTMDPGPKYIYKLLYLGFELKSQDFRRRNLIDRITFEGEIGPLQEEFDVYYNSELFKKIVKSSELMSDQASSITRVLIMNAFFGQMPHFLKLWPTELRFDLDNVHGFMVEVLAVIFPNIDWAKISEEVQQDD